MTYIVSRPWGGHCGIGHQFCNWMVAWQLANHYDLQFVHAPFCGEVIEQQIDIPVKLWENFLNLGQNEISESQLPSDINKVKLPMLPWEQNLWLQHTCDNRVWQQIIDRHRLDNVLFECAKNQFMRPDPVCLQYDVLRDKYWKARRRNPVECYFDAAKLNIAIHIRRGDISPDSSTKDRWIDLRVYVNIINQISNSWGNRAVFHIYSDGTPENFTELTNLPNVVLHLWEDVFITFHHMIVSDVLVIGRSSFSALAGHLHNKVKIIQSWDSIPDVPHSFKRSIGPFNWEYPPDNDRFITMDNTGRLDVDLLRTLLSKVKGGMVC